jgi:hypothetical protein
MYIFSLPGFVFVQKIDLNADRNGDEGELPPAIDHTDQHRQVKGQCCKDGYGYVHLSLYVFRVPLSYYFDKYNTNYIT